MKFPLLAVLSAVVLSALTDGLVVKRGAAEAGGGASEKQMEKLRLGPTPPHSPISLMNRLQ